jgi:hypothetical protein
MWLECLILSGEESSSGEEGSSSICDFEGEPFSATDKQVAAASRQLMAVVVDIIKQLSRQLLTGEGGGKLFLRLQLGNLALLLN